VQTTIKVYFQSTIGGRLDGRVETLNGLVSCKPGWTWLYLQSLVLAACGDTTSRSLSPGHGGGAVHPGVEMMVDVIAAGLDSDRLENSLLWFWFPSHSSASWFEGCWARESFPEISGPGFFLPDGAFLHGTRNCCWWKQRNEEGTYA